MKKTRTKKSLSFILCIVLIAAMALFTIGCSDSSNETGGDNGNETKDVTAVEPVVLGEGETQFDFTVTDPEGTESCFVINTDEDIVGEALSELGLIEGEPGPYGLYVKTVNGITVDYDTDGKYWAFYVDGEYATGGVDTLTIEEGVTYSFKVE